LRLNPIRLLQRTDIAEEDDLKVLAPRVLPILGANGKCIGRACLAEHYGNSTSQAVVTVGGLRAKGISGLAGVFLGHTDVVTRDEARLRARSKDIAKWATQQGRAWADFDVRGDKKVLGGCVLLLGGSPGDLPFLWIDGAPSTLAMLEKWAADRNEVVLRLILGTKVGRPSAPGEVVMTFNSTLGLAREYAKYRHDNFPLQRLLAVLAQAWRVKVGQIIIESRRERWRLEEHDGVKKQLNLFQPFFLRRPA
jgi:hypothetical protein